VEQVGDIELARRRSGWLIPVAVFFVTACFSALVLAYYFAPDPGGLGIELPAPIDSTRPVDLSVGETRFRIPANYLPLASTRKGGQAESIPISVLFPELSGHTLATADAFADDGPNSRVIAVALRGALPPVSEDDRLARIYLPQVTDKGGAAGPYGLRQYSFRADSGYHMQELFVGRSDSGTVLLLCTRTDSAAAAPNCMRDTGLAPGLSMSYRFRRASLKDWREIDAKMRALIERFEVKS
jgi:hypothetical protein